MKREPEYLYTGTGERVPRKRSIAPFLIVAAFVLGIGAGGQWEKQRGLNASGLTEAVKANTISYDRLRDELANVAGVCSMDIEP